MADTKTAPGTNGSQANSPTATRDAVRAATLAALESGEGDVDPDAPPVVAPPKPAAAATDGADDDGGRGDEDSDDDSDDADVGDPDAAPDPDLAKRLSAVQKAEKRSRGLLAKERADAIAEVEAARAEIRERVAGLESFEQLKARAKFDPTGVLVALGLGEDDFEAAARDLYARSKAGSADPRNREAASRIQRDREQISKVEATSKRLEELEKKLEQRAQQEDQQRLWGSYLDHAAKVIPDDAPLTRLYFEKHPAKARSALKGVTEALWERDGDVPDAKVAIKTYEKMRRAELEELGIDVDSLTSTKKQPQAADKKRTATTLDTDPSSAPRTAKSIKEHREETQRLLEAGKFE